MYPLTVVLFFASVVLMILAFAVLKQKKSKLVWLSLTIVAMAIWSLGYGFELASNTHEQMLFWKKIEYLGINLIPAFWLIFCIEFSGKEFFLSKRWLGLIFFFPVISYLIIATNEYHLLYYETVALDSSGIVPLLRTTPGVWYYIHVFIFYIMFALGTFTLIFRLKYLNPLFRPHAYTLLVAACLPWLINITYIADIRPFGQIDITPFAFILSLLIVGGSFINNSLFNVLPIATSKVIDSMSNGLMVLDNQNKVIEINPSLLKILPFCTKDLFGKDVLYHVLHYEGLHSTILERKAAKNGFQFKHEGKTKYILVESVPMTEKNGVYIGLLLLFEDITKEKKQQELLFKQAEELVRLNQLKDKLFSVISHDLKGPIQGIKEILHMTLRGVISKREFFDILPDMTKDIKEASNLLDQLLKWSGKQLKGEGVVKEKMDLFYSVSKQMKFFENAAKEKNIHFINEVPDGIMVIADIDMIELVLRNLIGNAIKFCSTGDTVRINANIRADKIKISVTDTGQGIKEEHLEKLLSGESISTKGSQKEIGNGLGLIMARDFIHKNGSRLEIKSIPKEGSIFSFELPWDQETIDEPKESAVVNL